MFVSHLPEKARVVDDGSVDDGAGQHGEERHEDGLEAEGERLVSHLDAAQGNQNIANPAQFIDCGWSDGTGNLINLPVEERIETIPTVMKKYEAWALQPGTFDQNISSNENKLL